MMPPRPNPRRDALDKRVSGAFEMMNKQESAPGAAPAASGEEQEEDQLLDEVQRALDQANEGLMKLRAVQQKEKGDGTGGDKINDDSAATGSPSMQGMA
jgi:hypothetical protein